MGRMRQDAIRGAHTHDRVVHGVCAWMSGMRQGEAAPRYIDARSVVWVAQTNRPLITETASDSPSNIPHLRVRRRHRVFRACVRRLLLSPRSSSSVPTASSVRSTGLTEERRQPWRDTRERAWREGGRGWRQRISKRIGGRRIKEGRDRIEEREGAWSYPPIPTTCLSFPPPISLRKFDYL